MPDGRANPAVHVSMHIHGRSTAGGCVQGDMSLIAEKGHAGLPMGHIIAYKADHEMHIEFAKQLKASCSPGDWVNADKAS